MPSPKKPTASGGNGDAGKLNWVLAKAIDIGDSSRVRG